MLLMLITLLGPLNLLGTTSVDDMSGRLTFVFSPSFLIILPLLGRLLLYVYEPFFLLITPELFNAGFSFIVCLVDFYAKV